MKKIIINICLLFIVLHGYAQQSQGDDNPIALPTIIPPSPTIANLMHFEEVPVDHYSGQADISIPLGAVPMLGGMQYPIGVHYNTQGIRIDERSGWLGTGFSMPTGGVISRTIKDIPDELNSPVSGIGIFHNGYSNYENFTPTQKEEFLWKTANGIEKNDASHDLYQYNFMGHSGRFIIKRQGNQLVPVIIGDYTNDKITLFYNQNFEITSFQIVDTSGYIYTFELTNFNLIDAVTISTPQFGGTTTATSDLTGAQNVPNTWYLKDIQTSNGIELCRFSYQDVQEDYHTPISTTRNRLIVSPNYGDVEVRDLNKGMLLPRVITSSQQIRSTQKYVDEVIFHDGTLVRYILHSDGHPEYGPHSGTKLKNIEIMQPNGQLHKRINFFYQTSANNRLFLTEIDEVYGLDISNYVLEYNDKDALPAFGSNQKDAWGYYSPNGGVDKNNITKGVLKSIRYPLGGKKEFTFESNTFSYQGAQLVDKHSIPENRLNQQVGPVELLTNETINNSQKVLIYIDRAQIVNLNYNIITQGSGVDLSNYGLLLSRAIPKQGVTLAPMPVDGGPINYFNYQVNDFEYHPSNFSYNFLNTNPSTSVSGGWYFLELKKLQPVISSGSLTLRMNVNVNYTTFQLNSLVRYGGGIRIKEVAFNDKGEEQKKVQYNYNDNHLHGGGGISIAEVIVSSGSYEFDMTTRTYQKGKTHPFITSRVGSTNYRTPQNVQYQVTRDLNEVLTPTTKGNYVGYKNVYVKQTGLGGELYTFISPRDVQIFTSLNTNYPFLPTENKDYKRGVVAKKEVFDESQKLLEKEVYDYFDISDEVLIAAYPFETKLADCPWDQFYNTFSQYVANQVAVTNDPTAHEPDVTDCISNGDMGATQFSFFKGVLLPKEVIKTGYFYDGNNVSETVTTSSFQYNNRQRISSKATEFNEGGSAVTYREDIFYPYTMPAGEFTTSETNVFFKMTLLNQIESPILTKQYKNGQLLGSVQRTFREFHTDVIRLSEVKTKKADLQRESRVVYHQYDDTGNLLEVSQTDGTRIGYVWGYRDMYPIAKMENASYGNFSAAQTVAVNEAITASDNDIDATSEGQLRSKLTNLQTGFEESMVATFTFDPLVGITSVADIKGYHSYFSYDDMYRLKYVKDADQYILSANEYFYRNTDDNAYNFVKGTAYQIPTTNGLVSNPTDKMESITYYDGLGRAMQSIVGRAGGQQQDIITPIEYDQWGRQVKEYLPYVNNAQTPGASSLAYRLNEAIITVLPNYYQNKYPNDFTVTTVNPFSEMILEASPLSRLLKQGAPGSDWSVTNTGTADHTIKSEYQLNSTGDSIRLFTVTYTGNSINGTLQENGLYNNDELYKSITKDENWQANQAFQKDHTSEVYTDKLGRLILKRNYANDIRHDTYYIYDDFGNLNYVLSPEASTLSLISQTVLDNLGYQYKYDHRNRLVEKKIPGKGWEYIVYDVLDRPILVQDTNMKLNEKWMFTKHDEFGRVAYTGMLSSDQDRVAIQAAASQSQTLYETRGYSSVTGTAIYYTDNVYPNAAGALEVLTVNYYDDYEIGNQITFNPTNGSGIWEGMSVSLNTKGLPTVSRIKVLETPHWITAATYYDEKGRAWESHTKNDFLATQDWGLSKLDFIGNVEKTMSMHIKGGEIISTTDNFTYDHANRLLTHKQTIDNQEEEVIVSNTYDDLGQLIGKGVGGRITQNRLQDVDFKYNVRGWLTNINDVENLGTDLFSFRLNYNQQEGAVQYADLFNGNISQTIWKTASVDPTTNTSGEKRGYSYKYDALNRIKNGIMRKGENLDIYTRHHLRAVDYDKNGNITSLKRDGKTSIVDDLTYIYAQGNQLLQVSDAITIHNEEGFKDGNITGNDYFYDANGNMVKDLNKGIDTIHYNHLNLPIKVTINGGVISYIYDATGVKQRKQVLEGTITSTTDYATNFQYLNDKLQFIATSEGYIEPGIQADGSVKYQYFYQYLDHLGNSRINYFYNEVTDEVEIARESNYYPFGLKHQGYNNLITGRNHAYGFGNKEEQVELGLGWIDITARNYDAALGRWMNIDPLADQMRRHSPYNYAFDNPIFFIDPDGMAPTEGGVDPDDKQIKKVALPSDAIVTTQMGAELNGAKIKEAITGTIQAGDRDDTRSFADVNGDAASPDQLLAVALQNGGNIVVNGEVFDSGVDDKITVSLSSTIDPESLSLVEIIETDNNSSSAQTNSGEYTREGALKVTVPNGKSVVSGESKKVSKTSGSLTTSKSQTSGSTKTYVYNAVMTTTLIVNVDLDGPSDNLLFGRGSATRTYTLTSKITFRSIVKIP